MDRPKFFMMCGLVGSGKSTHSKELAEEYNATIFSSDALREELFGNINNQEHNQEVFVELHRRIKTCLQLGKSAIMDSTNLNYKKRMAFLQELKNIPCEKICIFMAVPYTECLKRNAERDRKVPEYAIERMYRSIDIPYWYEGWDKIVVSALYYDNRVNNSSEWLKSVKDFNQDNPHHKLTLGEHCEKTWRYIVEEFGGMDKRSMVLRHAGTLHDIGKCFTKTFKNSRGETTDVAHYYSHEHVGSYDSLFYTPAKHTLDVAILIRWHMQPYFWERDNNEKLHNKYRKLWGEQLYEDVMKLHEADKAAH